MKRALIYAGLLFTFSCGAFNSVLSAESYWNLPAQINGSNAQVSYSALFFGKTITGGLKGLSGRVWLANQNDPASIRADIYFKVPPLPLLTGILPQQAHFKVTKLSGLCRPADLERLRSCKGKLQGTLIYSSIKKNINLPITILKTAGGYKISGKLQVSKKALPASKPMWPDNSGRIQATVQFHLQL